jgi:2-dehydro-3-deoxyphosphogluconate aldolase / (4S)-4-hydroxy-2-oxoglutarate aldolase
MQVAGFGLERVGMTKDEVQARINDVGIIPAVRTSTKEDALFAATTVNRAGIPIAEITVTVPGAMQVVSELRRAVPEMIVGAGTVLDIETAQRSLDAGAQFLTSTGLIFEVVEFAKKREVVIFPGALTPTEIIAAWKAGADLVWFSPVLRSAGTPTYERSRPLSRGASNRIRWRESTNCLQFHHGRCSGAQCGKRRVF